jgi:PAS domain S-box-containing protein
VLDRALAGKPWLAAGSHAVQFYEDDAFMVGEVAEFLDEALRCGDAAIAIATPEHRASLLRRLNGFGGQSLGRNWWPGELIMLDARQTLARFMNGSWPDEQRFHASVGAVVQSASRDGTRAVRAFGEMVALLCADGNPEAAVRLEQLWNDIAAVRRQAFSLLCCYPLRLFGTVADERAFRDVCATHNAVQPAETDAQAPVRSELSMTVAALQQKAIALENEVARRTAAEQTLRRRERELADFLDNAAEGLHSVDAQGVVLWANRAELEMLGYEAHEYIGHPVAEFHVDQQAIAQILRRLRAGETLRDEPAVLRCKNGTCRHVLLTSNASFDGGRVAYTRCFTRDVTERRAREHAERERNSLVMRAPVAAALLTGTDHVVRLANPPLCAMLGRSDLVGRPLCDSVDDERLRADLSQWLEQVYRHGESVVDDERSIRPAGPDRAERFYKLHLEPMRAADGTVYGVMVVGVDVSQLALGRRVLEQAHAERSRLLEELQAASRAKDEFLAMLGHELRNPLSPIVTALQLMKLRGDQQSSKEQATIQRQVEHLIRLVDDLLDVSRIVRGKIELRHESVEIGHVVAKAVEMASTLLEQRRHRLELDVPDAGLRWTGDPTRLAQVVSNLLTNAARYTEPGGQVRLSAARKGDEVAISVRDNGKGLSRELLPLVFDLFFQGQQGLDRREGGLGIGLALVKNLVELHGGTVHAHSDGPGQGSEFIVRLPIAPAGSAAAVATDAADTIAARRQRVLVVDDNVDAADTLGDLLRTAGHEVAVVYDAAQALAAWPAFAPQVALVDIGLPVLNGLELAQQVRQRWPEQRCRLVALTGYGQEVDRQRSVDAGFEEHLVKPIDLQRLLERLERTGAAGASS